MPSKTDIIANLINGLCDLPAVSPDAARAYAKAADSLVDHVNKELKDHSEITGTPAGNRFNLMKDSNSNHAKYMTTVLKTGAYELLVRTIPWMYRVYHARGGSYDYFPIEYTAWNFIPNSPTSMCTGDTLL